MCVSLSKKECVNLFFKLNDVKSKWDCDSLLDFITHACVHRMNEFMESNFIMITHIQLHICVA